MTLPAFSTVTGPVATDPADGATGYNLLAQQVENNFDVWNAWYAKAQASFASGPVVTGATLVTPATGWALDTYEYRQCWGRKWGGVSFISLSFQRTGATIAVSANGGGDIADTLVCTMGAGFRPLRRLYIAACYSSYSPCQVYLDPSGSMYLYTMASALIPFVNARLLTLTAMFPNADVQPYP